MSVLHFVVESSPQNIEVVIGVTPGVISREAIGVFVSQGKRDVGCCGFDSWACGIAAGIMVLGTAVKGNLRRKRRVVGEFELRSSGANKYQMTVSFDGKSTSFLIPEEATERLRDLFDQVAQEVS